MRKDIVLPAVALIGGGVGAGLRRWQLATGFEPETGLAIPGTTAAAALILCSVVTAALIVALGWTNREPLPWDRAFYGRGNTLYLTAAVLSAFLLLASAGAEVLAFPASYQASLTAETWGERLSAAGLPPLRILLCLGGCPCVLFWSRSVYRGGEGGKESLPLLELCLLYCVWLISNYQVHAADPVVMDYICEVLAICFSLVGLYYIASYSFQKEGKPRRAVTACLLGAYFSLVTMADRPALADLLRCGFAVLFLTAHAALLLGKHPDAGEAPAETETEAGPHA